MSDTTKLGYEVKFAIYITDTDGRKLQPVEHSACVAVNEDFGDIASAIRQAAESIKDELPNRKKVGDVKFIVTELRVIGKHFTGSTIVSPIP